METLNPEIRKLIAELDSKANELIEEIDEKYSLVQWGDELSQLVDQLNDLQETITTIQEKQGWI